jgi:hypothetical protein
MNYVSIGNGLYARTGRKPKKITHNCVQCQARRMRHDSIYCSEKCKEQFYAELKGETK